MVVQRLEILFPKWQIDFQDSQIQFRQKDLISHVEDIFHRDFEGNFVPRIIVASMLHGMLG